MNEGKRKWRSGVKKTLFARAIYKDEIPKLIEAMQKDDLIALIGDEGLMWYHGAYRVSITSVRFVWDLTVGQYRRIADYILVNDSFSP
jgi:hypothetical protein